MNINIGMHVAELTHLCEVALRSGDVPSRKWMREIVVKVRQQSRREYRCKRLAINAYRSTSRAAQEKKNG